MATLRRAPLSVRVKEYTPNTSTNQQGLQAPTPQSPLMTITSYEIAQQTGLTHAEVEHIITRFDARRIAAGGRPLEQRQTRGLRNGAPMTVCVLTDADMRFLSTCTRSRLWVRLYTDLSAPVTLVRPRASYSLLRSFTRAM